MLILYITGTLKTLKDTVPWNEEEVRKNGKIICMFQKIIEIIDFCFVISPERQLTLNYFENLTRSGSE